MITKHEFANLEIGDWIEFEHSYVETDIGEIVSINEDETITVQSNYQFTVDIDKIFEVRKKSK